MAAVPTRTCVVCRRSATKGQLLRVVRSREWGLVVDVRSVLPGRGAYVHRSPQCGAVKGVVDRLYYSILKGSTKKDTRMDEEEKLNAEQRKRIETELLDLVGGASESGAKPKRFRLGKLSRGGI